MTFARRLLLVAVLASGFAPPAMSGAPEKLRVGTPEAGGFNFAMLDAGIELKIYEKLGLDIERTDLVGGAKLHQAVAAGAIEVALGGGTDLAFLAKGSPEKAVAVLGTSPANLAVLVRSDSPIKAIGDLKGKRIGVTTVGSLTSWFATEISRREGWGVDGVTLVYVGGNSAMLAGLTTNTIDAAAGGLESAYIHRDEGKYRMLVKGGEFVPDFVASIIYASDATISQRPDALRRFLKGWFEAVRYLRDHKPEAIVIMSKVMAVKPDVAASIYDDEMPSFPVDGHFDMKSLRIVEQALVDFGRVDRMPDNSVLLTEAYLPPPDQR